MIKLITTMTTMMRVVTIRCVNIHSFRVVQLATVCCLTLITTYRSIDRIVSDNCKTN